MRQPVLLETEKLHIHSFRAQDFDDYNDLVKDVYNLFSDDDMLHFIPEKRLYSLADADNWLKSTILNFHCGRNYVHFIKEKSSGRLLGLVDIITPTVAKTHYRLEKYPYFIEFYLSGKAKGKKIMTGLLPQIVTELRKLEISIIGAVVNRKNLPAQKVLKNAGFVFQGSFDHTQDLYQISFSKESENIRQAS